MPRSGFGCGRCGVVGCWYYNPLFVSFVISFGFWFGLV